MSWNPVKRTLTAVIGIGIAAMASATPAYLRGPRPETGSFLNHVAQNLDEVVGQVARDPVTADRLMRHFRMAKPELVSYLRTLHMATLPSDGVYWVYNVHDDGVIRARVMKMPRGTLVYADDMGTPVLRHKCANPMTLGPKRGSVADNVALSGHDEGPTELAEDAPAQESVPEPVASEPSSPAPLTDAAPAATPASPAPPVEHVPLISSGGNPIGLLAFGAITGLGALGVSQDHSSPVPEPAGLVALAVGLVGLATKARRRSR